MSKKTSEVSPARKRGAILLAIATILIGGTFIYTTSKFLTHFDLGPTFPQIVADVRRLEDKVSNIQLLLSSATNLPPDLKLAQSFAGLSAQVSNTAQRIESLEKAINASPETALTIPMIQKNLAILDSKQQQDRKLVLGMFAFAAFAVAAMMTLGISMFNVAWNLKKEFSPKSASGHVKRKID